MSLVDDIRAAQSPDMVQDMNYEFSPVVGANWQSEMALVRDIVDAVPKIAVLSIDPETDNLVVEILATA